METKSDEKLSIIELLKRSAKLLFGNINLALFLFLFSLPLFCFLIFFELSLQTTVSLTSTYLSKLVNSEEDLSENDLIPWLVQTSLLYFFPYTFLDLLTTTAIVAASSISYTSEEEPLGLLYLVRRSFKICHNKVAGCLITSLFVLILSTSVFLGFFSGSTIYLFIVSLTLEHQRFIKQAVVVLFHAVVVLIHGTVFIVLAAKFSKWSAGWNISMVVSVLEEEEDGKGIYGSSALSLSAWYLRGQEKRDLWMMLMFLVGALVTRMPCLYYKCNESLSGNGVLYTGLYVGLICVGNMIKWVSCVVCYHDCNTRVLRKKGDVEIGSKAKAFAT
ncbi:hypothetical protein ISN45_Aa01g016310 [Arabidopsis thaliana x Arabidopsis arenosa]|uniref:Transmembrane protein n=1 Tax=Arabidopsis thaliana x Arabidopsis arenosa TaxID=1240361 RepID=A0A8T2C4F1_9BRAS|nr:hypothetical protein ISN45_Aa01g016310 [Arabidopsis thaliana x Arabidopsis arenosa]